MDASVRVTRAGWLVAALVAAGPLVLAGCSGEKGGGQAPATPRTATGDGPDPDVRAEREKLSPEDRAPVDAQEWCAINTSERLGSMGPPLKVVVKDQVVFLCCKGCQKKALADPDKTLAAVADLKAKAKAEKENK